MKLPINPAVKKETCKEHGEYESKNVLGKIWTKCPACTSKEIESDKRAEWVKKITKAGIDKRFHGSTFNTYVADTKEQKEALASAIAFADSYPSIRRQWHPMAFLGSPGCGKTHLAASVAIRVLNKHNGGVLMAKASSIASAVKETFSTNKSEASVIERYSCVGLLIIDEVCESLSDFDKRVLFDVIDKRYSLELPMIIISNLEADDFKEVVGERSYDRLRENHVYVAFCWESHRS